MWRYDIAPAEDGCDVTESFTLSPTFGLRLYWAALGLVPGQGQPQGHATTLERIRDEVEKPAGVRAMEDRSDTTRCYLELGDASPEDWREPGQGAGRERTASSG